VLSYEVHGVNAGKSQNPGYGDINLQRKCSETLEDFSPRTKSRNSRRVVHLPDGGGFSMNIGPYCHYAHRDGVSAVFSGEIGSWPGIDVMKMSHDGELPLPPEPLLGFEALSPPVSHPQEAKTHCCSALSD
jgi:hypothetical protein